MLPVSGFSSPSSSFSRVVLPAPLRPMIPILSPREIRVDRFCITGSSPYENVTFFASITSWPERSAVATCMLTFPTRLCRCRRSSRIFFNARTRPSFRVRRALIPCRIQTSSSASFLSNSAFCFSSASRNASLRLRKVS